MDILTAWSNFYVITGSSAGALTGLMFVVVTLVASAGRRTTREGFATFSSPTVLHFVAAFLVSVTLTAPWHHLYEPAAIICIASLYGTGYVISIVRRTRRQTVYEPDFSDWSWYAVLPLVAYVIMAISSVLLPIVATPALFALATTIVLLILIGIHNAWDIVTYITLFRDLEDAEEQQAAGDDSSAVSEL